LRPYRFPSQFQQGFIFGDQGIGLAGIGELKKFLIIAIFAQR
jgi:hypothetical protein